MRTLYTESIITLRGACLNVDRKTALISCLQHVRKLSTKNWQPVASNQPEKGKGIRSLRPPHISWNKHAPSPQGTPRRPIVEVLNEQRPLKGRPLRRNRSVTFAAGKECIQPVSCCTGWTGAANRENVC